MREGYEKIQDEREEEEDRRRRRRRKGQGEKLGRKDAGCLFSSSSSSSRTLASSSSPSPFDLLFFSPLSSSLPLYSRELKPKRRRHSGEDLKKISSRKKKEKTRTGSVGDGKEGGEDEEKEEEEEGAPSTPRLLADLLYRALEEEEEESGKEKKEERNEKSLPSCSSFSSSSSSSSSIRNSPSSCPVCMRKRREVQDFIAFVQKATDVKINEDSSSPHDDLSDRRIHRRATGGRETASPNSHLQGSLFPSSSSFSSCSSFSSSSSSSVPTLHPLVSEEASSKPDHPPPLPVPFPASSSFSPCSSMESSCYSGENTTTQSTVYLHSDRNSSPLSPSSHSTCLLQSRPSSPRLLQPDYHHHSPSYPRSPLQPRSTSCSRRPLLLTSPPDPCSSSPPTQPPRRPSPSFLSS